MEIAALGHDLVHHDAQAATCTEAGNSEYYTCSRCGKFFSDAAGTTETTAEAVVIPVDTNAHAWPAADAQKGIAWAWASDFTTATLTLTCANDSSHTYTETATGTGITSAQGTGDDLGYTVYTATVSFNGNTYTDKTRTLIEYSITYNGLDDATLEADNPTSYTVESDDITLTNPTREGYAFAGWTGTDLNEATMEVTIVAGSTGNREYTATWNPIVTFKANDGASPATDDVTQTVPNNTATALRAFTVEGTDMFTREGYAFAGWNTAEDGSGTEYADEAEVTITAPLTLYAQWEVAAKMNTFTHSDNFANVDSYLYRVGNGNTVKLGALFKVDQAGDNAVVSSNVIILVNDLEENTSVHHRGIDPSSTANCSMNVNSNDWTQSTLQFSGEGPVQITIKEGENGAAYSLYLEVVNGKNVTTYAEMTSNRSYNEIMLNNIEMSSNSQISYSGVTLYGNGFTFDVSNGKHQGESSSANYLVNLNNAKLDNVKITGAVYTTYGAQTSSDYNNPVVRASGNSQIANCTISNCASPVRVYGGNLYIYNTTLRGGNYANLDIRNGNITLENVTTINQTNANDLAADGSIVAGLGIVVYYENVPSTTTITVRGTLTQYNSLQKSEASYIKDTYAKALFNAMFATQYSDYQYGTGNNASVNTGIVSMISNVGESNLNVSGMTNRSSYKGQTATFSGRTGYVFAPLASSPSSTTTNTASDQYYIEPTATFDYTTKNYIAQTEGSNTFCVYDSTAQVVNISFDEGSYMDYDPAILTVTKYGIAVDYTIYIDDVVFTGSTYRFSSSGNHVINYTYSDQYNYRLNDGSIATQTVQYTKTLNLSVTAVPLAAKDAVFTFYGYGGISTTAQATYTAKVVQIGSKNYVMPNVSATSDYVKSTTISNTVVYCPVVYTDHHDNQSDFNWIFPLLLGLKVEDYANGGTAANPTTVISPTSGSAPDTYSIISGDSVFSSGATAGTQQIMKLTSTYSNTYKNLYGYVSSAKGGSGTYDGGYVYPEFSYKDNKGTTYYFVIAFNRGSHKVPSCIASGTLITLANGTQKAIENVSANDHILAWDFIQGQYVAADVFCLTNHGEAEYEVLTLSFDNGTRLEIIRDHGLFDYTQKRFVNISADNVNGFIGHSFTMRNADGTNGVAVLTGASTEVRTTTAYSIITSEYLDVVANGLLTADPSIYFLFPFEVMDNLQYDPVQMQADIDTFGLLTYEEFQPFAPFMTENQFYKGNGFYIKIALGKGIITMEEIIEYAQRLLVDQQELID